MENITHSSCAYCRLDHLGMKAACAYMRHLGYEIIDQDWHSVAGTWDLVARKGIELVFVKLYFAEFKMPPSRAIGPNERSTLEQRAIAYLAAHQDQIERASISFDIMYICIIGEDRAMVRHHRNILSAEDGERLCGDGTMTIDELLDQLDDEAKSEMTPPEDVDNEPPFDEE